MGYVTKVVNIIPGVTKNLNVRMRPDDIMLDEVVVKPNERNTPVRIIRSGTDEEGDRS